MDDKKLTLKQRLLVAVPATGVAGVALAVPAFAEGETPTVQSAITSMATTVATDGTNALIAVLPVLAPLIAAGIVAALGVKFVRRFGK